MGRKYSEIEKQLLKIIERHFSDAIIEVKNDVGKRKTLQMIDPSQQKSFSPNQFWNDTFMQTRFQNLTAAVAPPINADLKALPASSSSSAIDNVAASEKTSSVIRTVVQPDTSIESKVAGIALESVTYAELMLNPDGTPKMELSAEEHTKVWTRGMDGSEAFCQAGIDFIDALQTHLKQRNPGKLLPRDLDYSDGPIPQFFSLIRHIIQAACNNIESMPLRSHYLLLLVRYTIDHVIMEKDLVSGWNQDDASLELKAFLSSQNQSTLEAMDLRARHILANAHGPQLVTLLRKKDEHIRSETIKLLFTLFYTGDSQMPKSAIFLENQWKVFKEQSAEATRHDQEPPAVNLLFLLTMLQIQASKSTVLPEVIIKEEEEEEDDDDEQKPYVPPKKYYSDEEDEDDDILPVAPNLEMTMIAAETEKVMIKRGSRVAPLDIQPGSNRPAPLLTPNQKAKIKPIITHALGANTPLYIGEKLLTEQQLVEWGIVDPEKTGGNSLIMALLSTPHTRERLYRTLLLRPESGIPSFIINHEFDILERQDEALFKDLLLIKWQLVLQFFTYYCLCAGQSTLAEKNAQATGEWGLFLVLAGPSRAGFKLTDEAVTRLIAALSKLEQAVQSFVAKVASKKGEIPESWRHHLIAAGRVIRQIQISLGDVKYILKDLEGIAEQWHKEAAHQTDKIKKLFQAYEDGVANHAQVMSEFLGEDLNQEISQLAQSQSRDQRGRVVDDLAQKLRGPRQNLSAAEVKNLSLHGTSGGRTENLADPMRFQQPVLTRNTLLPNERKTAEDNERQRTMARKKLEKTLAQPNNGDSTRLLTGAYVSPNGNGSSHHGNNNNNHSNHSSASSANRDSVARSTSGSDIVSTTGSVSGKNKRKSFIF
jgi:hypothetical protein